MSIYPYDFLGVFENKPNTDLEALKNIVCIGAGYVGGPTCAVLAQKCPDIKVTVLDKDEKRIDAWNTFMCEDTASISLPIHEPDLLQTLTATKTAGNLTFSTDLINSIASADLIFICVNTPTKTYGKGHGRAADLTQVENCARLISKHATGHTIVVEKSTVPVKAAERIDQILNSCDSSNNLRTSRTFQVLSNPEFLSEGNAISELTFPDRVLIGACDSGASGCMAVSRLAAVYARWVEPRRVVTMSSWSAELSKLAANAFLAQRVSSVNALTALCEQTGADIRQVAAAVGLDARIGPHFLRASAGFGGSCFKKDILSLSYFSECQNLNECSEYWASIVHFNEYQKTRFARLVIDSLFSTVNDKNLAIFGFTFKAETGDTRESCAIEICLQLLEEGARLNIFDPAASELNILSELRHGEQRGSPTSNGTVGTHRNGNTNGSGGDDVTNGSVTVHRIRNGTVVVRKTAAECVPEAHAIIVLTEWAEFHVTRLKYDAFLAEMMRPAWLFDGRSYLDHDALRDIGFNVYAVGRKPLLAGDAR